MLKHVTSLRPLVLPNRLARAFNWLFPSGRDHLQQPRTGLRLWKIAIQRSVSDNTLRCKVLVPRTQNLALQGVSG
jgi:hypothetical protein